MKFIDTSKFWIGAQFPPRAWQAQALPKSLDAITPGNRPIIRAVTGSGKSVLIAEICHAMDPDDDEVIVITTPTQALVKQLHATISKRVGRNKVGMFYANKKQTKTRFIVTCIPSAKKLGVALAEQGSHVGLWVADECHRTESDNMLEAVEVLKPRLQIGFTATPFRSDTSEELSLWDEVVWDYGPKDAIKDGVVVPWELRFWENDEEPEIKNNLHAATAGDQRVTIDDVCIQMIKSSVDAQEGPGIVNAISIDDAEIFAAKLQDAGVRAQPIHSKLKARDQAHLIKYLKDGKLDCLVHISMLQEGVDFPWLMWLCLRRPVQSRVRFIQEAGRVLRSHPGKSKAIIYDPHDLFSAFKLDYEAVLNGDVEKIDDMSPLEIATMEVEEHIEELYQEMLIPIRLEKRPVSLNSISAYLRRLAVSFEMSGRIKRTTSTYWRKQPATEKQVALVWKMKRVIKHAPHNMPGAHRRALAAAVMQRKLLTKGEASDLLSVLVSLGKNNSWPDLANLMS